MSRNFEPISTRQLREATCPMRPQADHQMGYLAAFAFSRPPAYNVVVN